MSIRRLNIEMADVQAVYEGPGGVLWEMLMGEEIHVNGEADTDILARKIALSAESHVLDVCSALGGPARHLAMKYGCRVTGLDATPRMHAEAIRRTAQAGMAEGVTFRLGDALNMPFEGESFDVVWGQDAWCYVTDKGRLIQECVRVLRPGGWLAFTDWLEVGPMGESQRQDLCAFMVFPYLETLEGYSALLEDGGLVILEREDLSSDFAAHMEGYLRQMREHHRPRVVEVYGQALFDAALEGITLWRDAAKAGWVGRGRFIACKGYG